ncbi:MAG: TraR/DksA C4-type zinc finger protein [Deltaproteobacteria bacterium]|nr:TraR/DksA C4-type zinc finger protein [Deltaproteobacteria bacterium]
MNSEEKKTLKEKVALEMEALQENIKKYEESSKPVAPDNSIGRLTRMEAINAKSISEASLANAKARLRKLGEALADIDDPEFGVCRGCGESIPVKRIMLMPESEYCVSCAGR